MDRVLIATAIAIAAGAIALALRRRRPDAPAGASTRAGPSLRVPAQLDRDDFARPDAPWVVAVFTATTCDTCATVRSNAEVLASDAVAVAIIEYPADRELHERYGIDAVPLVVVADADGVVRRHHFGPIGAADLWAAVAAARDVPDTAENSPTTDAPDP